MNAIKILSAATVAAIITLPSAAWANEPVETDGVNNELAEGDLVKVVIEPEASVSEYAFFPTASDFPAIAIASGPVAVLDDTLVSDAMLNDQRGGAAITVGNQTLAAISNGNVLNGDFTAGAINLTDNSFSGFNGFGNLVINTGAQNNLQSGMNVTINFAN
jgi:hypothetical protein